MSTETAVNPVADRRLSRRVLVVAPVEGDAPAVVHVLAHAGFEAIACADMEAAAREIGRERGSGAGAAVIAQEALLVGEGDVPGGLARALAEQPAWSDLPVILLAGSVAGGDGAWEMARRLDPVGNITILERPLRRTTLLNAVDVALRARARQYELRKTMEELGAHRERLRELVEARTRELSESMASLHAAERLASLGTLAAGLGHDIANLTLPIRVRLEALRASCTSAESLGDIDAIATAMEHLVRLSAGMRLMGVDPQRATATGMADDLTAWAVETTPMLRASLPRGVRLETRVEAGLGVRVPRHRLAQAVFNLVQNAGEAIGATATGSVRVVAENADGGRVRMCVEDDGPGMSAEVLARCFEPYFSTKGRAIVTGMGLGMVRGIVEEAGGTVEVRSELGKGTVFTLLLPATGGAATARDEVSCAISVENERRAGMAAMFAAQLGLAVTRHRGAGAPSVDVWVADGSSAEWWREFLGGGGTRRLVVLTDAQEEAAERVRGVAGAGARMVLLPETPTPSVLRDGLRQARAALDGEGAP